MSDNQDSNDEFYLEDILYEVVLLDQEENVPKALVQPVKPRWYQFSKKKKYKQDLIQYKQDCVTLLKENTEFTQTLRLLGMNREFLKPLLTKKTFMQKLKETYVRIFKST